MKRAIMMLLVLVCTTGLLACSGNVMDVEVSEYNSKLYADAEIEDAIAVTKEYFKDEFIGCTLETITYAGDEKLEEFKEYTERYDADETIVLISSFSVAISGADGSLNPGSTYTDWNWILVRDEGGEWRHVDHGY